MSSAAPSDAAPSARRDPAMRGRTRASHAGCRRGRSVVVRRVLALMAVTLLASYPLGAACLAPIGRYLVHVDPIAAADAILPLAGDPRRIVQAAALYREGYAPRLWLTPLPFEEEVERQRHVAEITRLALRQGVPREALAVVPHAGHSTYQEARNVRRFAKGQGVESLLLVTSPWHTRRTSIVFHDAFAGSGIGIAVHPVGDEFYAPHHDAFRPTAWWTHQSSRRSTLSEYVKLLAHYLGVR